MVGDLGKGKLLPKLETSVGSWAMNSILAPHNAARTLAGKTSWITWAALSPDARAPSWGKTACPSLAQSAELSVFMKLGT